MAFTFFFRDQDCLEMAVRSLLLQSAGRRKVRIWDAGCAMGHEPYTLAMLLSENMGTFAFRNLEIHATDYDEPLLRILQDGTYPYEEVKRVPEAFLLKYFEAMPDQCGKFRVIANLRQILKPRRHDLLSCLPVHNDFSLVVCKNVLLHFQPMERVEVIRMFHKALEPMGLLLMERTQKMPHKALDWFEPVAPDAPLFRKLEVNG
jgi:chemotaxis protein methyltransferase CheR